MFTAQSSVVFNKHSLSMQAGALLDHLRPGSDLFESSPHPQLRKTQELFFVGQRCRDFLGVRSYSPTPTQETVVKFRKCDFLLKNKVLRTKILQCKENNNSRNSYLLFCSTKYKVRVLQISQTRSSHLSFKYSIFHENMFNKNAQAEPRPRGRSETIFRNGTFENVF